MVRFLYIWQLTVTGLADGQDWSGRKWEESSWITVSIWKPGLLCVSRITWGFPCGSAGKESACNAGDLGLIPGLGRFPGERYGYPLQYSSLKNSVGCIVHGVTKSWTQLSDCHVQVLLMIRPRTGAESLLPPSLG